jgi:hypothetical protein
MLQPVNVAASVVDEQQDGVRHCLSFYPWGERFAEVWIYRDSPLLPGRRFSPATT